MENQQNQISNESQKISPKNEDRKLASVQLIQSIIDHPNADKLLIAKILGWQVIINKEQNLKANDKVIYFEIDSILPNDEEWSKFMEKYKFSVKTIKLRKEISQGLIIPLSEIFKNNEDFDVGYDLTNMLKVTKYDDEKIEGQQKSSNSKESTFPVHLGLEKTDEPRIQSYPKYLEVFQGKPYVATLKYDGTSATFVFDKTNEKFLVCSRNNIVDFEKGNLYWDIALKNDLENKLKINYDYAIQGEIYGPKIQNNNLSIKERKFVVFNIYSFSRKKNLDHDEMCEVCLKLKLDPVQQIVKEDSFNHNIDSLLDLVKGNYPNSKFPREGLVFRLQKDWDCEHQRASFKVINNDYLLKKG